jgi:hypothetical protein
MARFTTTGGSGDGTPGAPGAPGADGLDGADALWNFTGEYNGGASYAIGDIATYDGQLWYRAHANGGTVGNVPSESFIWNLLAAKGTDGAQGDPGTQGSPGLVYLGDFIAGNGYVSNLAVVKGSDNNLYIAKASGELGSPIANPGQWELFLPKGETGSSITWSGAWDAGTNYPVNYAVSDNGSSYIKILTDPSGVFPLTSETQYWNLLAEGGSGSSADIADFVFTNVDETNSSITVTGNKELTIQSGSSEDLNVRAGDDLWLTADDNIIVQADDELNLRSHDSTSIITNYVDLENAEHEWLFGSQGYLTLPGGAQIVSQPNSSGDGSGFSTLELVPDGNLETNQYIIIDPTDPNHIHIRAGGEQDASSADLFIGGERNNIRVSDSYNNVLINTRPDPIVNNHANSNQASNTEFMVASGTDIIVGDAVRLYTGGPTYTVTSVTPEYPYAGLMTVVAEGLSFVTGEAYTFSRAQGEHTWDFTSDGTLSGPSMGGLKVLGLLNSGNNDLGLYANDANIILQTADGKVDIIAPEVNIVSNVVPSSFNINTYLGASVNSNRTSTYAVEDKVVATLGDIAKTNGSWTVTTGTNTYNFTLPSEGTYTMWVKGNIPNGIILWNATVSVSNSNVPAIGSQYAWNYTSGGSPILITAIPNQIRGVAGTINTDTTYMGNTSNRFDFIIANTSDASVTVYYGYTKI